MFSMEKRYASLVLDTKRYKLESEWLPHCSLGKATSWEDTVLRPGWLSNAKGTMSGNCHVWEELQAFRTGTDKWLVRPLWA